MSERSPADIAADHIAENADVLVSAWIKWIRKRVQTETIATLPESAIENHIPPVLATLSDYLRNPLEAVRVELSGHLRMHGQIRRDQGYSLEEVLAEFDGLADLVTRSVQKTLEEQASSAPLSELLSVSSRLSNGLRTISFVAMGTFTHTDTAMRKSNATRLEEFARAICHELRTPLSTMRLGLDAIRKSVHDRETVLKELDVVDSALRQSFSLLDTIQMLAVTEGAGAGDRMVSLKVAIENVMGDLAEQAKAANVAVQTEGEIPGILVEAIPGYIVLVNLINNAIKYADPDKDQRWVRITARLVEEENDTGFCEIKIQDNGVGIPGELIPRVLQKGFRCHPDLAHGTGMGLYIVNQTVAERSGTLDIDSTEGKGTTVTVCMRYLEGRLGVLADSFRFNNLVGEALSALLTQTDGPDLDDADGPNKAG